MAELLLVSSDVEYRAVMSGQLKERGYGIAWEADTIAAAYPKYVEYEPDCIIIDLMPNLEKSRKTLGLFRKAARGAKIIVMTDVFMGTLSADLKYTRMLGYACKVWKFAILDRAISRVLRGGKFVPLTEDAVRRIQ